MLTMIGYDLHRDPRNFWDALHEGARKCGDVLNLDHGPIFVDTDMVPSKVLATLETALMAEGIELSSDDQLLVLPLAGAGYAIAERKGEEVENEARDDRDPDAWFRDHQRSKRTLLAVTYRLPSHRFAQIKRAIESQGPARRVLDALWFLPTDKPAAVVCDAIWNAAGLEQKDWLRVFAIGNGAEARIKDADVRWFSDHGVELARWQLIPAAA